MTKMICIFCEHKFDEDDIFHYENQLRCPNCGESNCFVKGREITLTNAIEIQQE